MLQRNRLSPLLTETGTDASALLFRLHLRLQISHFAPNPAAYSMVVSIDPVRQFIETSLQQCIFLFFCHNASFHWGDMFLASVSWNPKLYDDHRVKRRTTDGVSTSPGRTIPPGPVVAGVCTVKEFEMRLTRYARFILQMQEKNDMIKGKFVYLKGEAHE